MSLLPQPACMRQAVAYKQAAGRLSCGSFQMNPYDPPCTRDSAAPQSNSQKRGSLLTAMSYSAFVAFVVSSGLALWSGETEPFTGPFDLRDAILSLVGGGIAFLFWVSWAGSIVLAVRRRWIPPAALAFLLLALLGLLLSWMVVLGYLGDRQSWATNAPF